MTQSRRYLFIYDGLTFAEPEANLGSGKTVTAFFSESGRGSATALASSTKTATASGGAYTITYTRAELQTALGSLVGKTVFLHRDDGAVTRDIQSFLVTDEDPDTLPSLLT